MAPTVDPSWVESGLIPTDNRVDDDGMAGWDAHTVPAGIVIDEDTQFKVEQKGIEQIIAGASAADLQKYIAKILKPRADEVRRELQTRREEFANETAFTLIEGPMINFADKLDTLVAQAVRKIAQAEPKPVANVNTLDARAAVLETRINNHVATLSGKNLRQFYEEQLKPKATAIKAEIDFLELSEGDPTLLQDKKKHLDVIAKGMATSFIKIMDERRAEREAAQSIAPAAIPASIPAAPVVAAIEPVSAVTTVRNPPAYVPTLTEVIELGPVAAAKAAFIITTAQDRARATLRNIPASAEIVAFPLAPRKDEAVAKVTTPSSTPSSPAPIQIGFEDDGITTVEFKEVKAEPKTSAPWWKRAAVAAAWVVGYVAVGIGGTFLGVAGKIAYQDHVRDAKIAAAATEQFNQAAESSPAQRAVDLAKEKGYYSPFAESAAKVTPAPEATIEPVAVAPGEAKIVEAKQTVSEPKVVKTVSTVKAKADFKPAAAVNDDQVTYTNAIIAKPFDIATSRVGLDTWNGACSTLKARGVTVSSDVCPS